MSCSSSRPDTPDTPDTPVEGPPVERPRGSAAVVRPGSRPQATTIPSGSLSLDLAIGGGYPRGRVIEIYGPESAGKTTLSLHAIASCQTMGGVAACIDAEHALDPAYARALGVRVADLLISHPEDGEQALSVAESLVRFGGVDLLVIDSVAALVPRAELASGMGASSVGLLSRMMSQALRKLTGLASHTNTAVIFTNQLRHRIATTWGSGEVTPGGNALKFYASLRLDVRRIGALKDSSGPGGSRTRIRIVKNKLAPAFRQVDLDIRYGEGVCAVGDLLDLAESLGVIQRSASWYAIGERRLGQGRARARQQLSDDPELIAALHQQIHSAHAATGEPVAT